nr:hypothetical protein [Tanacetum cinerariifolium]
MCTKFLSDETDKVDKYISGIPDNIHGNIMSARPKTLYFSIELANDLMDHKLCTYAKRQAENKRKLDNNNQDQQQLLKKQNLVQAYAVGSGKKKPYEGSKPMCPKCNYHHDGECAPKLYTHSFSLANIRLSLTEFFCKLASNLRGNMVSNDLRSGRAERPVEVTTDFRGNLKPELFVVHRGSVAARIKDRKCKTRRGHQGPLLRGSLLLGLPPPVLLVLKLLPQRMMLPS